MQCVYLGGGALLIFLLLRVDYNNITFLYLMVPVLALATVFSLIYVMKFGAIINGARRAMTVIPGVLTIQPAEFAKLSIVTLLSYIFAKSHRCFKPLVIGDIWHNDSHINVAPGVGIAFGIRAEHHDFGIPIEARQYHLLVLSNKLEGFIACEHFWSIHCCNCLVCSTICLVFSSFSMFAMLRL